MKPLTNGPPSKRQRGEAVVAILIISTLLQVIPLVMQSTATPEPRCWGGYLYDGMNGRQIIGEAGGGIPCKATQG